MNSHEDSDEDLARRGALGDRLAFEELVRRHKVSIYAFIRRYVGQREDAYDVLQNVFLAAWLGLKHYDPARSFLPWLRTIALNKCRDHGRRESVRRLLLLARAVEPQASSDPGADDAARLESPRLEQLDIAIAALPPFYKEPLLLTLVSGLSHQEAAAMLKTTRKAVEMRIRRAREQLAKIMGDREG